MAENSGNLKSDYIALLLNASNVAAALIDRNHIIIELNEEFARRFNSTTEKMRDTDILSFFPENIKKTRLGFFNKVIETGKPLITYDERNGIYNALYLNPIFSENKQITYVAVYGMDITKQHKAEQELSKANRLIRESEEKYRAAFYTSPDSININRLDGLYVDINEGFTKLTGFTKEEVIGRLSSEIQIWAIPEDRQKLIEGLKKKGMVENLETVFRLKDGTLKTGLMSAKLIDINNEPHILSVTRDISERKKMENDLVAAKEKAEESDRLKTAFLQNLSHEIRTPLNGIIGFSELIKNPDLSDENIKLYSDIISESGLRLLSVVSDLLDISRIETGQVEISEGIVDLDYMIKDIHNFYLKRAKEGHLRFYTEKDEQLKNRRIKADEHLLRRILNNLLDNAFKFTEKGRVCFGYKFKGDNLEFFVSDTGVGIAREFHHIIFERFQQADSSLSKQYGGTGLGLAICRGLVESLGGKINLNSEPGRGSLFSFTIPNKPVTDADIQTQERYESSVTPELSGITILIVEDEPVNQHYYQSVLKDLSITVIKAYNGIEAIRMIEQHPEIKLVLMDIKMPQMDGYEATQRIRKLRPEIPVIAQTAYAITEDRGKAIQAGCTDYFSKPVSKEKLIDIITRHATGS